MDNEKEKKESKEYSFVKETILDRKTILKRAFLRIISNLILLILACIFTSMLCIHILDKYNELNGGSDEKTNVDVTKESSSVIEETTEKLTPEQIKEQKIKKILSQFITVTAYVGDRPVKFSGPVISKSTDIIMLIHSDVLQKTHAIYAQIGDRQDIPAEIVYENAELPFSIIKIEEHRVSDEERKAIDTVRINSEDISIGQQMMYFGWVTDAGMAVVDASILSQGEEQYGVDVKYIRYLIDTDIDEDIKGYLFNDEGELVAMSVVTDRTNGKVWAVDMAFFSNMIRHIAKKGNATYLGIVGHKVNMEIKRLVGMELPDGVYVHESLVGSPAYEAGIVAGDIIYAIDGEKIADMDRIRELLDSKTEGASINVSVHRIIASNIYDYSMDVVLGTK